MDEQAALGSMMPSFAGLNSLLSDGGLVVAILLIMSVLALAVVLLKLWQFIGLGLYRSAFIDRALGHWRQGEAQAAFNEVQGQRHPVAKVLAVSVTGLQRGNAEGLVREEATRVGLKHLESLRGNLRLLDIIASLSPLLGLLGTVLGMIEAFQQLESAAGGQVDPAVLSGGIWEALLTTAVGLAVAIPATAALSLLERGIERVKHRMEDAVTQVFTARLAGKSAEPTELRIAERRAADAT